MLGLYLVNGRLQGDSMDCYTFSSALGSCMIEDVITDLNPLFLRAFIAAHSPARSIRGHKVKPLNPINS